MTLGNKIQSLREEHSLSQKELANLVGVTTGTIAEWEAEESAPSLTELSRLSKALNVSSDVLLDATTDAIPVPVVTPKQESVPVIAPAKKRKGKGWIIGAAALCVALIAAVVILWPQGVFTPEPLLFSEDTAKIETADASVVTIFCYDHDGELAATGSGFVAFDGKTIITNYHVMTSAYTCKISTNQDISYEVSKILCYSKEQDIAILQLAKDTGLQPLTLGDSSIIKKGETVVAIGSPLGIKNTVSTGVLSGRLMEDGMDVLQFTAPISSGSSGGALFDNNGNVIGITYASYIDGQNLNLAIPIELAENLYSSEGSAISLDEFYHSRYSPLRQELANWIITNGEKINYRFLVDESIPDGHYVHYYDESRHYWLEYHETTNSLRIICQTYLNGAMFPNYYSVTLSANSTTATFEAYDIDGNETGEILVRASGEFDISTFHQDVPLYCTEYDAYNEYFGTGKQWFEFEPIYRMEICNIIDWLIWLLEEEVTGVTIADLGFTSY